MRKSKILLNKPIYVGMCVLDLSKVLMYDFYYNLLKKEYPDCELMYTDTDSLLVDLPTKNMYKDMESHEFKLSGNTNLNPWNNSAYPKDHPLFNTANKKAIGKFKDEFNGTSISEFVGLRPKLYAILLDQPITMNEKEVDNIKKAKGIKKYVIKNNLRHEDYKHTLFEKEILRCDIHLLQSKNHEIHGTRVNKITLSPFDSKRYISDDGIHTLAYGLHSDQGRNFESKVIQELCKIAGVQKSRTTPYHPMGNGMTERYNLTLLNMLGTLSDARKANWKDYVAPLVHAYNSTKHDSTGFSPFYLMFGREPRIPVDVQFGLDPNSSHPTGRDSSKFVENLRKRLNLAYDLATKNAQVASKRNKVRYDAKRREAKLLPGDRVLVRNVTPSGKLDNKWEKEVYVVDKKPNEDIPVYIIRREDGVGRKRTLHRNLLLPCPLPLYEMEQKPTSQRPRKEFAVRSPRSVETPESDEEDNNQYAIRLRERHGGNENTPLRMDQTVDVQKEKKEEDEGYSEDEFTPDNDLLKKKLGEVTAILDMDGYMVDGVFRCKEMGWKYLNHPLSYSFPFYHGNVCELNTKDRFSAKYVEENVFDIPYGEFWIDRTGRCLKAQSMTMVEEVSDSQLWSVGEQIEAPDDELRDSQLLRVAVEYETKVETTPDEEELRDSQLVRAMDDYETVEEVNPYALEVLFWCDTQSPPTKRQRTRPPSPLLNILGYPLHSGNTPEPPSPGSPQAQELMNSYDDQYIDDLWQCMVDEPTPTLPPIPLIEEEEKEESEEEETEAEDYQDLFDDLLNTQTGGGANENKPLDANSAEDYFVIENVETRNCPKFHAKQLVFKTTIHNRPRENIEEAVAVANSSIRRLLQHVLQELQAGNTDYVRLVERGQRLSQVCGPRANRSVRCEALDSQELVSVKKSVVQIKKTEDGSCAFHAIVVGQWMVEGRPRQELTVRQEEEQARALCTRSGLRWGACGRVELFRLQEVLKEEGVRLHVYYHDLNCIGFAGDLTEFGSQKPTCDVYLFHHDEHYDVITTMTGFLKKNYFCPECDVGYSEKSKHKCRPFCECCYETIANCSQEVVQWTSCPTCHRHFKSDVCFANHNRVTTHRVQGRQERWSVCQRYRRCVDCQKVVDLHKKHQGLRDLTSHRCGEQQCIHCRQWVLSDHLCHVQPMVIDENDEQAMGRFIFFDIETMPLEAVHRVNLVVAMKVCTLCVGWTNHDGQCEQCGERQMVFATIDAFCTWLFRPEHQNSIVFAHNFMGYDSYFLLEWLCARGQRPEVVMRGAKCMYMYVKGLNLKFKDSLCFLPMALRKFSKTFNLPEEKGYFPHFFNTPANQDYVGPYPVLEFYGVETMKEEDAEKLRLWHTEQRGKTFHLQEELKHYCQQDVILLKRGVLEARRIFLDVTGFDPFVKCITLASACMWSYRYRFMPPNSIGIIPQGGYTPQDIQSLKAKKWLWRLEQQTPGLRLHTCYSVEGETSILGAK
ncbi:hypothetical protein QZH41_001223 [Actinostola sp. cb2023]|nr:hypothetical protein QZH41_001223 [Actinostola sp. cb2023]